jgi:hypothetical protein
MDKEMNGAGSTSGAGMRPEAALRSLAMRLFYASGTVMVAALALRFAFRVSGHTWRYIGAIGMLFGGLGLGIVSVQRADLRRLAAFLSAAVFLAAILVVLTAMRVSWARPALAVVALSIGIALATGWKRLSSFR